MSEAREELAIETAKQDLKVTADACRGAGKMYFNDISKHIAEIDIILRALEAAEPEPGAMVVDDLVLLVKKLVYHIGTENTLSKGAMDYLKRKGLEGSPLRKEPEPDAMEIVRKIRSVTSTGKEMLNQGNWEEICENTYSDSEAVALIESYGHRVPKAMLEEIYQEGYATGYTQPMRNTKSQDIERIADKHGVKVEDKE